MLDGAEALVVPLGQYDATNLSGNLIIAMETPAGVPFTASGGSPYTIAISDIGTSSSTAYEYVNTDPFTGATGWYVWIDGNELKIDFRTDTNNPLLKS